MHAKEIGRLSGIFATDIDGDDFEGRKRALETREFGKFLDARSAPGRPEIEEHIMAAERLQRDAPAAFPVKSDGWSPCGMGIECQSRQRSWRSRVDRPCLDPI